MNAIVRCAWATSDLMIPYHDREWGVPVHDDATLFEFVTLEGAQAGLSWETILRKRERYRDVFAGFDVERVARFTPKRVERLMADPGIVRNRLKIEATISNARAVLAVCEGFGSFDAFLWRFVDGTPLRGALRLGDPVPATSALSDALSKDLRARGFRFVGSTIVYAFMQAVGMLDDHVDECVCRRDPASVRASR